MGWIYEYALVDRTGRHDLAQLRALQDWFLKYELKSVPDVAEVATIGGMVRQYQVVLDPDRLRAYGISHARVVAALRERATARPAARCSSWARRSTWCASRGYLKGLEDFRAIPLSVSDAGTPVTLGDVARIQMGPEMRRGIAELDGEGEVVGGVVVMRSGRTRSPPSTR